MIFRADLASAINAGLKTQTRRLKTDADSGVYCIQDHYGVTDPFVVERNERLLWEVGRTYAIQPGRGQKAIGRFELLRIRQQPLQSISFDDACAELGVSNRSFRWYGAKQGPRQLFATLWNELHKRKGTRWEDNPQVWVLTIRTVEGRPR